MGSLALLWRSDCPGEAVVKIQGNCAGTKLWLLCGVVPWLLSQWLSSALVGQCLFLALRGQWLSLVWGGQHLLCFGRPKAVLGFGRSAILGFLRPVVVLGCWVFIPCLWFVESGCCWAFPPHSWWWV